MARPSTYGKTRTTDEVAAMLARQGLTDAQIAEELGVSERTLDRWKQSHPELSVHLGEGKEPPDAAVEASLFKRALGFTYTEGDRERVALPDVTACKFWLMNRRPDRWRDVKEVSVGIPDELIRDLQITLSEAVRESLSPEDGDRLMRHLGEKLGRVRG